MFCELTGNNYEYINPLRCIGTTSTTYSCISGTSVLYLSPFVIAHRHSLHLTSISNFRTSANSKQPCLMFKSTVITYCFENIIYVL